MSAGTGTMMAYEPGDYIKVEFRDERSGESEWMWVRVEFVDDSKRIVFGWLDSQPVVLARELRVGQRLAVSYENIREHAKATEFRKR